MDLKFQKEQNRDYCERLRINNESQLNTLKTELSHRTEMQRIMNANEENKISLNNQRLKDIDNHNKDMKIIENQHAEEMEKINNDKIIKEMKINNETKRIENQAKDIEEKKKKIW